MTEQHDFHYWRDEMARLVALREAQEARRLELQHELIALDARRGASALAALQGGDDERKALQLVEREINEVRGRVDTVDSLLRAAGELVVDAKARQRAAVALELRRMAEAAEVELTAKAARISALTAELQQLMGGPVVASPNCPFAHEQQRPARMRGAADMVQAGHGSPTDPTTGLGFDRGLW